MKNKNIKQLINKIELNEINKYYLENFDKWAKPLAWSKTQYEDKKKWYIKLVLLSTLDIIKHLKQYE